jgi:arylsulfatase
VHAVDLAATVLDISGAALPSHMNDREQMPLHGASIAATFGDAGAPAPRQVQYFEQMGHRGIWHDGWKATTYHEAGTPFEADQWGLYHLEADFSECHDLAAEHPERLAAMVDLWWQEAETNGVLPLDDRTIELFGAAPRPGTPHFVPEGAGEPVYTYHPPLSHLPSDVSPSIGGKNWEAEATFEVADGGTAVAGVLYARGSHNVGHCWWVADGEIHFDYNALGARTRARGPIGALAAGRHSLGVRFVRDGKGGVLTLLVDGSPVGEAARVPRVVRILGSTGTDIGRGPVNAIVPDLTGPTPFSPALESVVFRVLGRRTTADPAADAAADLAATVRAELSRE